MASNGWIKLHREITEWEWYDDHNVFRLFIHLLIKANHKKAKWRGVDLNSGDILTGRKKLASETGLSEQQIRTAIDKLKSTNDITIKVGAKNSVISITNWDKYQSINQQDNQEVTSIQTAEQPQDNHEVTTDKNDKKEKNVRNIFKPPLIDEVKAYCLERKNNIDPESFIDYYEANGWMRGKAKIKDWKACVRTWEKNNNSGSNQSSNQRRYEVL